MARPRLTDEPVVSLATKVPESLANAVTKFQEEHGLNRSEALRLLLEHGLEYKPPRAPRQRDEIPKAPNECRHPVSRIIGGACAVCGTDVTKTKKK